MRRVSGLEGRLVREVLRSEFRSSKAVGMLVRAERAFQDFIGVNQAIGCVNGTATLHVALEALGIGVGDEVIVPSLTMSATCFSVLQANATPVFADVDEDTWQIDPVSVRKLMNRRTKAIISVALYGGSPHYAELMRVAGSVPIIEDNAQALGTTYNGKQLGSFGAFSSYSFQSSKQLTAGEGGMLCTVDSELSEKARLVQTLGYSAVKNSSTRKIPKSTIQSPEYLRHESLGWNYRMPEITAAVVLGQVMRAPKLLAARRKAALALQETLTHSQWLKPQLHYPEVDSSFWALGASIERNDIDWHTFASTFRKHGGKGVYSAWALGYQEPAFQNLSLLGREEFLTRPASELFAPGTTPVAEGLQKKILAFRTNEWTESSIKSQVTAMERTVSELNQI